ncbi:MAG: alanyl-tRNA synthetase [Verrucomicrobiota bacterium]|jgi:alanyl-tRNA synthetase
MTSAQLRQSFLEFFREKKHTIVPSASLLPDSPNLLFTNAGMNQFVPIFLGRQKPSWNPPRVADTQKCIRAGGKHNDLEDVGLDTYHLTFFEMLGNWSFGDYFKKEAIEWAWELIVERWKLPPQRLYATVYKPGANEPSEFDQEAHDHWAKLFRDVDLDPKIHVVDGNKKDNFWMMGDTGPCGPCSELHVDLTPDGDTRGALVNKDDPRCIEIWNLVFIQFNANADGSFTLLPQRHVDTGMGFERMSGFYAATKGFTDFSAEPSAYNSDGFTQIFDAIGKLSGKKYGARETPQDKIDIAFRVIADHIRTLSFAIADGIIPSNEGRGYVLRRILRRGVRYGRTLDFHEPFFFKLVDVVTQAMGDVFPEVRAKQKTIEETIRREEESFNKTLDEGIRIFEGAMTFDAERVKLGFPPQRGITAQFAFQLYDTYGFPLDLTELMARERGLVVDVAGFEKLMEQQRARARASQKKEKISVLDLDPNQQTKFVGYDENSTIAKIEQIKQTSDRAYVVPSRSPFYAEMGGQVSDTGTLRHRGQLYDVIDTQSQGSRQILALAKKLEVENFEEAINEDVQLQIDVDRRRAIEGHHTVTHLLHWALHELVSRDAAQKGSYVGPDKLTFDFSSAALIPQQKRDVEKLVNEKIHENAPVSWTEIPYAEAKKLSDIQQFFGDKYGDVVRVVQIGGEPRKLDGYSMELCGGTHVRSTSEIGAFRIVREEAIAAGIRRIEAVAGDALKDWAKVEAARQDEKFQMFSRKKSDIAALPTLPDKIDIPAILDKIDERTAHLEKIEREVRESEKQNAKATEVELRIRAAAIASELAEAHAGKRSCVVHLENADGALLQAITDVLKAKFDGPIFLASASNGRVELVAAVPKDLAATVPANKIMQQIAAIVGGKGGGRPESARGAGSDVGKIDMALSEAKKLLVQD